MKKCDAETVKYYPESRLEGAIKAPPAIRCKGAIETLGSGESIGVSALLAHTRMGAPMQRNASGANLTSACFLRIVMLN